MVTLKNSIIVVVLLLIIGNGISAVGKRVFYPGEERKNMSVTKWESFGKDLAIDVYEENSNVIAKMNVPGIAKDNIQVSIENGNLHVSGKREEKKEIQEKDYYHKEIKRGSFDRVISLPDDIDASAMTWELSDGVLTVTIPKK